MGNVMHHVSTSQSNCAKRFTRRFIMITALRGMYDGDNSYNEARVECTHSLEGKIQVHRIVEELAVDAVDHNLSTCLRQF